MRDCLYGVKIEVMSTNQERYHHGDLRTALVDAALRTLESETPQAISLRGLAREAGVSHAAPYHHFADLDALLAAVAARGFQILRDDMSRTSVEAEPDPFIRLQAAGTAYVTFAVTRPELFRLMFSGRWKSGGGSSELREAEDSAFETLERMTAGAVGSDEERAGAVSTAARAAWAMVHGIAMLLVDNRIETPAGRDPVEAAEQLTREMTTVLGRGLRSL